MTDFDRDQNVFVRSIVLMSAMSAAADVVYGMAERRRGHDPSSQEEPKVARQRLRTALDELEDHLVALRAGRALRADDERGRTLRLARAANEMLLLNRLVRVMHTVHQSLLSLYPFVPEELVEQARLLERGYSGERDRIGRRPTPGLIGQTADFNAALRELLKPH